MKKLINKLFKWFGYVPKQFLQEKETEIELLKGKSLSHIMTVLKGEIKAGYYRCKINDTQHRYVVYITNENEKFRSLVKSFINEDADYAKNCAEDLVEMLNKNY